MLYHFQRELLGDIENLTRLPALKLFPVSQIAPAVLANVGLMDNHTVGDLHPLQVGTLMTMPLGRPVCAPSAPAGCASSATVLSNHRRTAACSSS